MTTKNHLTHVRSSFDYRMHPRLSVFPSFSMYLTPSYTACTLINTCQPHEEIRHIRPDPNALFTTQYIYSSNQMHWVEKEASRTNITRELLSSFLFVSLQLIFYEFLCCSHFHKQFFLFQLYMSKSSLTENASTCLPLHSSNFNFQIPLLSSH